MILFFNSIMEVQVIQHLTSASKKLVKKLFTRKMG